MMYRIRRFEETVLDNFPRGVFFGTTHTYLGQEANAVGVISALVSKGYCIVSNHRCHGHFLAYGGSPRALFAELMGKASGVCGGRGGSQHLHWRNFYLKWGPGRHHPAGHWHGAGREIQEQRRNDHSLPGRRHPGRRRALRKPEYGLLMAGAGVMGG